MDSQLTGLIVALCYLQQLGVESHQRVFVDSRYLLEHLAWHFGLTSKFEFNSIVELIFGHWKLLDLSLV